LGLASAAVLATVGLALPGPVQAAAALPTAASASDCPTAYPAQVSSGQAVTTQTVTTGTTPTEFAGTVTGVVKNGIAPDVDMILIDFGTADGNSTIDTAGIWEGMSGSPVYDKATGQIIGAVSYTLSYGPTTVAGVTPYAAMKDLAPGALPTTVHIKNQSLSKKVARATGVKSTEDARTFRLLPTPVNLNGPSADRLRQVHKAKKPYLKQATTTTRAGVAKPADAPGPETMVAGGNIAAALVYGDVVEAGIGTITSVCHGGFVAFGHPMASTGKTTMAAMSADAVAIIADSTGGSFKQANIGKVTGTVTEDRTPGIAGSLGAGPRTMKATATSSYGSKSRTGASYSASPDYAADAAFGEAVTNNDAVLNASYVKGGALATYAVRGTDHGKAFSLGFTNRYADPGDISSAAGYPIGDLVYALSQADGVTLTSVSTKTAFNDVYRTRKLGTIEQKKGTKWIKVTGSSPITVKAGGKAVLRFTLTGGGTANVTQRVTISIPKRMKHTSGYLDVTGGGDTYADLSDVTSVAQARKVLAESVRSDALGLDLSVRGHGQKLAKRIVLSPGSRVVGGAKQIPFVVTTVKK